VLAQVMAEPARVDRVAFLITGHNAHRLVKIFALRLRQAGAPNGFSGREPLVAEGSVPAFDEDFGLPPRLGAPFRPASLDSERGAGAIPLPAARGGEICCGRIVVSS
jgi:hypothetical protein